MSLKRALAHEDASQCVFEDTSPAFKRLRITDSGAQLYDTAPHHQEQERGQQQQQQQLARGALEPLLAAAAAEAGCEPNPMNAVLKQLHMERLQRMQERNPGDQ